MLHKNVYYVLQYNGIGKFELAHCHPLLPVSLDGKDGWEVASGPYDNIGKAGKALCLAVESYDLGAFNAWVEAREDLLNVVRESVNSDNEIDTTDILMGISQLLEEWDTG